MYLFNILVPREMFPHSSLITPGSYLGTMVALTECEVERISADEWYRTLEQDPERYREAALALEQTLRKLQRRVEMTTVPKSLAAHSLAEKMAFRILLDFIAGEIADSGRNGQFLGMSR